MHASAHICSTFPFCGGDNTDRLGSRDRLYATTERLMWLLRCNPNRGLAHPATGTIIFSKNDAHVLLNQRKIVEEILDVSRRGLKRHTLHLHVPPQHSHQSKQALKFKTARHFDYSDLLSSIAASGSTFCKQSSRFKSKL